MLERIFKKDYFRFTFLKTKEPASLYDKREHFILKKDELLCILNLCNKRFSFYEIHILEKFLFNYNDDYVYLSDKLSRYIFNCLKNCKFYRNKLYIPFFKNN